MLGEKSILQNAKTPTSLRTNSRDFAHTLSHPRSNELGLFMQTGGGVAERHNLGILGRLRGSNKPS
jgi:hypothetical protein